MERGTIEVAPLAFMRGRTLNDSLHHPRRGAEHEARADADVPDAARLRLEGRRHRRHHADRPSARAGVGPHPGAGHPRLDRRDRVHPASATRTSCGTSSCSASSRRTSSHAEETGTGAAVAAWSRSRSTTAAASTSTRTAAVELARRVLAAEGVEDGELGLVFVGPDEMRALKREHLGDRRGDRRALVPDRRARRASGRRAAPARRRGALPAGRRGGLAGAARARAAAPARLRPRRRDGGARGARCA